MEIDGVKSKRSGFSYIQELKEELKKVSWTSQEELRFATKMVVMTTLFFGIGIYLVDFLIKGSLEMIRTVIHFIFG
ncbi:MAG: preprotein translocase subunit SecE [Rhabdochlamydiaceae bacterium]|nr:preprotein translocase subunit SecE [Rhabdochlamydiaceae bacterium]